jgi:hypothetical protein
VATPNGSASAEDTAAGVRTSCDTGWRQRQPDEDERCAEDQKSTLGRLHQEMRRLYIYMGEPREIELCRLWDQGEPLAVTAPCPREGVVLG